MLCSLHMWYDRAEGSRIGEDLPEAGIFATTEVASHHPWEEDKSNPDLASHLGRDSDCSPIHVVGEFFCHFIGRLLSHRGQSEHRECTTA